MRSLLLFLIYLLHLILSIISSFFIVFEIGSVFMILLLNGFHLISPHVLNRSPSKIPLHLFQIFLVVYLKVSSLTHFFTLFIQPYSALSSPRTQPIITSMSMIPSYTSLSLLQIGTIMKFCRQMRNWHTPTIKFALLAFYGEFTNKTKTKQHTKQRFLYMNSCPIRRSIIQ